MLPRRRADAPADPALGHGRARRRRTWPQRLALVGGCLASMAMVASAATIAYVYGKFERLPRVELSGVLDETAEPGEPENYLIVGVDSAEGLDRDDPVRTGRGDQRLTDTIMIVRIDPATQQAAMLSLPRDLWVRIPGGQSSQRINAMMETGGPELLIETIDEQFGIAVNHYVQVDFASFRGLVDAVGGVPVHLSRPARDRRTGLHVTETGCVTLGPTEALAYVRSRHYQELIDGEWVADGGNDLSRIARQQDFVTRALTRAIERGGRSPGTLDALIDVGLEGIAVDDGLTADDIFRLGNRFSEFDTDDLVTYSLPVEDDTVGAAQVLRTVEDEAEPILDVFRGTTGEASPSDPAGSGDDGDGVRADGDGGSGSGGTAPGEDGNGDGTVGSGDAGESGAGDLTPEEVRVRVENGSGASGEGTAAGQDLGAAGFGVTGVGEAATFDHTTTEVRYPAGERDAAEVVARWLGADADLVPDDEADTVVVVTGEDWDGVRAEPRTGDGASADQDDDEDAPTGSASSPSLTTVPPDDAGDEDSDDEAGSTDDGTTTTTVDLSAHPC